MEMDSYRDKNTPEYSDKEQVKKAKKKAKQKYYEHDIKKGILSKSHMFRAEKLVEDNSERVVVYEKAIMRGKCIMDCLIADSKGTIIGLEIKTERDSTQRLKKQLHMYSLVCKYVYVVCHDSFVDKVENILKRYKYNHVGIISYISFNGEPTFGKYKQAQVSPTRSAYHTLDILWKQELIRVYSGIRNPQDYYNKNGITSTDKKLMTHQYRGTINKSLSKPNVIANMIGLLGEQGAYEIYGKALVFGVMDSEKMIDRKYFKPITYRGLNNDKE